jgi:hypothetical protein
MSFKPFQTKYLKLLPKWEVILIIVLCIILGFMFFGKTHATEFFTDDFEDYSLGRLGGQHDWIDEIYSELHWYKIVSSTSTCFYGKCIEMNNANSNAWKTPSEIGYFLGTLNFKYNPFTSSKYPDIIYAVGDFRTTRTNADWCGAIIIKGDGTNYYPRVSMDIDHYYDFASTTLIAGEIIDLGFEWDFTTTSTLGQIRFYLKDFWTDWYQCNNTYKGGLPWKIYSFGILLSGGQSAGFYNYLDDFTYGFPSEYYSPLAEIPETYSSTSWTEYYTAHTDKWATSTELFEGIANSLAPVISLKTMLSASSSADLGMSLGSAVPVARGYLKTIDDFFGGLPISAVFIFYIATALIIIIFKLVKDFIHLIKF